MSYEPLVAKIRGPHGEESRRLRGRWKPSRESPSGGGTLCPSRGEVEIEPRIISGTVSRSQPKVIAERLNRLIVPAQIEVDVSQVEQGAEALGAIRNGLPVMLDRHGGLSQSLVDTCKVRMGVGIVGLESEGLGKMVEGTLCVPPLAERGTQIVMSNRAVRVSGQAMPEEPLARAFAAARTCDVMVVVGSSLVVQPAARIPEIAAMAGAALAIVNNEPTPLDRLAEVVVRGGAGAVLAALADALPGETQERGSG